MDKMHLDLEAATNYMVQLFYKTGRKYSCTRTKLGKMLAIVAFKSARRGIILFDQPIYKYGDDCGAVISGLAMIVDRDAYLNYEYLDEKDENADKSIDPSEQSDVFIPEKYKRIDGLSDEVIECITSVFQRFGGYSALLIGHFMNDLIGVSGVTDSNGVVDLQKISKLSEDDLATIPRNRLVAFLYS